MRRRCAVDNERSEPPSKAVERPLTQSIPAVAITSLVIRANGSGGYTGTLKGTEWGVGGVYVHGNGPTVSACLKGLITATSKGRWLRDKYPD